MTVAQRLLLAADVLAIALLLWVARGLARMFLTPDAPTPSDQFGKLALLLAGPPVVVVALGVIVARWWRRPRLATALLALPPFVIAAWLVVMMR